MTSAKQPVKRSEGEQGISPPAISLPKGGGAIRGIGEKFAANPVTGTGSMTVPIATSPGRSGFGPQLSLSYDSGAVAPRAGAWIETGTTISEVPIEVSLPARERGLKL